MTGGQLQKLLDRAGLSQRGAAKAIGINERTMRKYVAGESEIPLTVQFSVRWLIEQGKTGCLHEDAHAVWRCTHCGKVLGECEPKNRS